MQYEILVTASQNISSLIDAALHVLILITGWQTQIVYIGPSSNIEMHFSTASN